MAATESLGPLAGPRALAGSSRFDHHGTTITLIPRLAGDATLILARLEQSARAQGQAGVYLNILAVSRAAAFVILATRGPAASDRILAGAFPPPAPEPGR